MFESPATNHGQTWQLRGVVSNPRYATAAELKQLAAVSPPLGQSFEDLVNELRASEEWQYVEREVDIRLVRRQ
jgi:hypothetical protein